MKVSSYVARVFVRLFPRASENLSFKWLFKTQNPIMILEASAREKERALEGRVGISGRTIYRENFRFLVWIQHRN